MFGSNELQSIIILVVFEVFKSMFCIHSEEIIMKKFLPLELSELMYNSL